MGGMIVVGAYSTTPTVSGGSISQDHGSTWASFTLPNPGTPTGARLWSVIKWNGSYWCAISVSGGDGTTMSATSPDGTTWTASGNLSGTVNSGSCGALAYGNGIWVLLPSGSQKNNVRAFVITSTDGLTWTQRTVAPATSASYIDVVFDSQHGVFCAVASQPSFNSNTNVAMTSPDGINWTARTLPLSGGWRRIGYANGKLVAVGDVLGFSTNAFSATSTDGGVTWPSNSGFLGAGAAFEGICWNPSSSLWVAPGNAANLLKQIYTSPDGTTWTARDTPNIGSCSFWNCAWDGSVSVCLVAPNGPPAITMATSPDGITWTLHTYNMPGSSPNAVSIDAIAVAPTDNALVEGASPGEAEDSLQLVAPPFLAYCRAVRTVRFQLPFAPDLASSTTTPGDALNPATWQVGALTPISVAPVSANTFDVTTLELLPSHLFTIQVGALGILWLGIPHTYAAVVKGIIWQQVSTPDLQAAQRRNLSVDFANPTTYRSNSAGISGTLVVRGGDYATVTGPALIRKLIYRRLTTPKGGFFHMPEYGLGILNAKDLVYPNDLVKLKAEVERQCRLEPEVVAARAEVRVSSNGVLYVQVFATVSPDGQIVEVSANSQSRIGA